MFPRPRDEPTADPDKPTHAEDGTDLSLIRWALSLTPEQRLRTLQNANPERQLDETCRPPKVTRPAWRRSWNE
jgi:hypothetical protein